MLRVMQRLLRETTFHQSGTPSFFRPVLRRESPVGCSTLITSAPKSPSRVAISGPAKIEEASMTRRPASGRLRSSSVMLYALRQFLVRSMALARRDDAVEGFELREGTAVNGVGRIVTLAVGLANRRAQEKLQRLVDVGDAVDVELARGDGFEHIVIEDEIGFVGARYDGALRSGEAAGFDAGAEEAFDLLVRAADGLGFAALIHRAGQGEILADG